MALVDHDVALSLLVERLGWPVKLVRWRAARALRELMQSEEWGERSRAALLDWLSSRRLESEVTGALSVLLVTDPAARPSFDAVVGAITWPSLLADLLLERCYGPGRAMGGWERDPEEPPEDFEMAPYFLSHRRSDVPPVLLMNLEQLEKRHGLPFTRQWAYEWDRIMSRTSVPYSDYPSYFGDYGLAQYGAHPQVVSRQSEVFRSAYQRTLSHAVVAWGMPLHKAAFYAIETLPVLPRLFDLDLGTQPDAIDRFRRDACGDDADLEALARSAIASLAASPFQLAAITAPAPYDVSEFGRISLTGYLISNDFVPTDDKEWRVPIEMVMLEGLGLHGDMPDLDIERITVRGKVGTALPLTFEVMPRPHGFWHDEIIACGMSVPCSYCFDGPAKIDALAVGIVTESLGRRTSKTQVWLDRWTPLHEPDGHTRCGVLCMADNSLVAHAKSKLGFDLAWRVEVVTWAREKGYGDLKKQARAVFFRD